MNRIRNFEDGEGEPERPIVDGWDLVPDEAATPLSPWIWFVKVTGLALIGVSVMLGLAIALARAVRVGWGGP